MNVVGYVGRLKGRSMGGSKTTQPFAGQWECENANKVVVRSKDLCRKMNVEVWRQLLLAKKTLPLFERGWGSKWSAVSGGSNIP